MTTRRWPVLIGLGAGLAALAVGLQAGRDAVEGWQLAARWTARIGFPLFLIAYLGGTLVRLAPAGWSRALARDRRRWGLGFAACHTVHLVALLTFLRIASESRTLASLVPGGLGYVLLYAMALTSNDAAMRGLGRNWKRLHTLGIHYLWLIYTLAYAGRIGEADTRIEGVIGVSLGLTALALRLAARRPGSKRV